ncbi:unnamed protein product [Fructobacillus tropaeoli]|uniref:hypothetical protein n=1 Tax=Fructobacillus tropaeoli TaxID=709323 RepID=UPI002D873F6D|nr:unnamed protein product [Fructobacillus tropaeoli]
MGLFNGKNYMVVESTLFSGERKILDNVTLKEAEDFINKHNGFFGDGKNYNIKKK